MKDNLSLIQPLEYNNLYSSYHKNSKLNRYLNYKLPKIKLFPSQENRIQGTSTVFNKDIKSKIIPPKINTFKGVKIIKQKKIKNPFYSMTTDIESNNKTNGEIIPSSLFHLYKINHEKKVPKINADKVNKTHRLNMIYLNLFKYPSEDNNTHFINFDSFYKDIDNFEINNKNNIAENEILSKKLVEINKKSIIKIKNIFDETDFSKLNDDLLNINNNKSKGIIDIFIQNILNKNNKINENNFNNSEISNINGEKSLIITNNIFLDWILDNVRRKIELKNEFNQHLTTVWVRNVIYSEINELKNRFAEFRKSIKLSNYLDYMNTKKKNNILNKKNLKKNDKSNITSSTLRSYLDNSYIKSFLNNSNINSNNYSKEIGKKHIYTLTQNNTLNDFTVGFDFFYNKYYSQKRTNYNNKKQLISINNINNSYNTQRNNINRLKYMPFKKTSLNKKNKVELNNNDINNQGEMLFKNVYLNNPRGNKAKNFDIPSPTHIKSRIDFFNNSTKTLNKNNDIIDKIKDEFTSTDLYNYTPKKHFTIIKRRNSFNYSNNEEKYLILKLKIKNINDNKNTLTPTKEIKLNREEDIKIKPKFKNVILMNKDKLLYNKKINKKNINKNNFTINSYGKYNHYNSKKNSNNKIIIQSKKSLKFKNFEFEGGNKKISRKRFPNIKRKKTKKEKNKKDNEHQISFSSSSSSSSDSNEENEIDTFKDIDIKKEINEKIRKNLVKKHHKTQKTKLTLFQINAFKKKFNNNNINQNKKNENSESSILSISSIDEQEELNENIEIKKEIDLLSNILSNNDINILFNNIMELKDMLRKRNKTEDIKKEIQNKRNEIKEIIYSFFEQLLNKLSIKEIKEEEQHLEIFKELQKLQNFGIYTSKDLNYIVNRILEERHEELLKYEKGYDDNNNKKEISKNKKMKRRNSAIEGVFNKQKLKIKRLKSTIVDNYFKFEFNKEKRKKANLIYNNSYLFKENDSDDENTSNSIIKKEIQEILNFDYGNTPTKIKKTPFLISKKRKKFQNIAPKEFIKKRETLKFLRINDEELDVEMLLKNKKRNEELEEQLKKEEIRDKKIYDFFAKIQKLKKGNVLNNDDEINSFIDQQIELNNEIPRDKNGGRLNIFLQDFQSNRIRAKYNFNLKYKKIGYISPIIFTSPNETYNFKRNIFSINNKK